MTVNELADKKRGRPLLLGCELDKQVQEYLILLCENGPVIPLWSSQLIGTSPSQRTTGRMRRQWPTSLEKVLFPYVEKRSARSAQARSKLPCSCYFWQISSSVHRENFVNAWNQTCVSQSVPPTALTDSSHWMLALTSLQKNFFGGSFRIGILNRSANNYTEARMRCRLLISEWESWSL